GAKAATLESQKKELEDRVQQLKDEKSKEDEEHAKGLAALKEERDKARADNETYQGELRTERNRIRRALTRDAQTWTEKVLSSVPDFRGLDPEGRRTPIISVLNLKGGVGKTTTTANLGAALDTMGYRVLFVDLDLQGSLSSLFLDEAAQKEIETQEAAL